MAKARLSWMLGDIHGSIGPIQFARSKSVLTLRSRPRKTPHNSPACESQRTQLKRSNAIWLDMSASEQLAWTQYALTHKRTDSLGQVKNLPPRLWLAWWIPFAEAALPHSLSPDYSPPYTNYSPINPYGSSADFSHSGNWNVTTSWTPGGLDSYSIRFRICPLYGNTQAWPRAWISTPWIAQSDQEQDYRTDLEAVGVSLAQGQNFILELQGIATGSAHGLASIWYRISDAVSA
jgi:hypothetical protein